MKLLFSRHKKENLSGEKITANQQNQKTIMHRCLVVAVGSSGILKAKQKLGVTFNFDKQDVIDFTKFSKMTKCRASEANS